MAPLLLPVLMIKEALGTCSSVTSTHVLRLTADFFILNEDVTAVVAPPRNRKSIKKSLPL